MYIVKENMTYYSVPRSYSNYIDEIYFIVHSYHKTISIPTDVNRFLET